MVECERMQILFNHRPALLVLIAGVHHFSVAFDESQQRFLEKHKQHPVEQIACCSRGDENQPPPQEQKRPLVEHVDHQHALDTVTVQIAQQAYFEIAQCYSGKMARPLPMVSVDQIAQNCHTPQLIFRCQERVEQEKLTDGVDKICKFYAQIQHRDLVTIFVEQFASENSTV
ncbi:hypothetical protein T4E_2912 [Trichinella pseudospiralis]|uniref:Uncharacterized protein n=1 Tax=Trichinella pseudospiralis TaxID=6337 RepID=A0A0V0XHU9_TRIPS|nr:hypothetical protein T4E_2912 [Trichinella pseudospiralis]